MKLRHCTLCLRYYGPEENVCPAHPENALDSIPFETALLNLLQNFYDLAREYAERH